MQTERQPLPAQLAVPPSGEISAAALLASLAPHAAKPLIFSYEGSDVLPGYHVTEVKSGAFQARDCGANFESWHETFIQLWDVPSEDGRGFMPVAKFLAIVGKVAETVPFDLQAKLTFEVSDGRRAMQIYRASSVAIAAGAVRVQLTQRPASCKPRDRWLEQQPKADPAPCCGPAAATQTCCS
jgi:hypothetical protein